MIQHVWERVQLAKSVSSVVVATDDERVLRAVRIVRRPLRDDARGAPFRH